MYDSIDWQSIPSDAELVAGYMDGPRSEWPAEAWLRFTRATLVGICTWGPRHLGTCLDIETGDSEPADIPDWADDALARGVAAPILYCSLSRWAECRWFAGERPVLWWVAHFTGIPHLPPGADACQWGDLPTMTGGPWDLSLCQPWFPGPRGLLLPRRELVA